MIWVLKVFILEEINLIWKAQPSINNDRSIRRGPATCGRKNKAIWKSDRESYGDFTYKCLYLYVSIFNS
jgi:hypothetical protein